MPKDTARNGAIRGSAVVIGKPRRDPLATIKRSSGPVGFGLTKTVFVDFMTSSHADFQTTRPVCGVDPVQVVVVRADEQVEPAVLARTRVHWPVHPVPNHMTGLPVSLPDVRPPPRRVFQMRSSRSGTGPLP